MGSIGKNKNIEVKYSEGLIQEALRHNFLSPSSIKYLTENLLIYNWESDMLKITKSGYVYEFEIKISKADFKNDFKNKKKKHLILENSQNTNKPNYFYYVVPDGLIDENDIPEYAGLIYVHSTIIGNSKQWFSFEEIKKAPKLHNEKINEESLNLTDKFYYNYRHWKQKHETDLISYKTRLDEVKTAEGKTYKYTLPEAMDEISRLNEEVKMCREIAENWKKIAQQEISMQRKLARKLLEMGITYNEQ